MKGHDLEENITESHYGEVVDRGLTWFSFYISEVRLYLMILEKLELYEKALGVLRSNLAGECNINA